MDVKLPERSGKSHKGENGKLLVVGGSVDYTGAPSLVSKAALRAGSDLVKIFCPANISKVVAGYSENFIVEGYSGDYLSFEHFDRMMELSEWSDGAVIGPGLSDPEDKAVREFLTHVEVPVVADADAIQHVSRSSVENAVLTPHEGEFDSLMEDIQDTDILTRRDVAILRKGARDRLITFDRRERIDRGNSSMTVGGTGDTLAGVVGSLLVQGLEPADAAYAGGHINAVAGELASQRYGKGMTATDLIERIPDAVSEFG